MAGAVPVALQGSVVDPGAAQAALDAGAADLAEMTRAQIADADLVAKLRAGTPDRIRPCILCNQTCRVRDNRNPVITCIADPRTGHETTDPPPAADPAAAPFWPTEGVTEPGGADRAARTCSSSAGDRPGWRRPGSPPGRGWRSGWPSGRPAGRHLAGCGGRPGPGADGPSG